MFNANGRSLWAKGRQPGVEDEVRSRRSETNAKETLEKISFRRGCAFRQLRADPRAALRMEKWIWGVHVAVSRLLARISLSIT